MHVHKAFRLLLTILAVVIRSSSAAAFLIDGVTVEPSPQGGQTEIRGAAELVSALLRHQVYLLNTSQRATLGEIDRQFREFQSRGKKSTPVGSDLEFAQLRKAAGEELLELLNSIPSVVRASVIDNLAKTTRTEPVTLPGDAGALLLRIQSGDEETRCETLSYDLSGAQDAIRFEVAPSGVTWALIDLSHVPNNRTSLLVKLDGIIDRWIPLLVDVTTKDSGRLKVTVLSAGHGEPVPVMVRLVWKTDGSVRKPGNAIEFAPNFSHQGDPADPRNANLPGWLAGEYWCVPGPFDMTVPPGDWEITIRRGVEHTPIVERFNIRPGQRIERTYRLHRWVEMRKRGWYSGDVHVHFRMVSDSDAKHMMAWAKAEDIHVANILEMGDINRTWFEQRGFGKAYRYVDGDYVLVPGQECPRSHEQLGHTLSLNTRRMVRDFRRYYLYDEVFDAVHAQGGLSGYAHVGSNKFHVHRDMSINVPGHRADFVEVMQFGKLTTELYYEFLNLGFKLTAAAGSDVPWGGTVGEVRMYAYVGREPFSPDAWFDAVKRGRTFVTNGPMIELRVDGAVPGDEVIVTGDRTVRVQARTWCDPQRMVATKLQLVRNGDVIRNAQSSGAGGSELSLDFSLPGGHGFWIAARAECSDGSEAHTTPVYVIRRPLRFWKYPEVGELVGRRLQSLTEVEQVVATARQLDGEGRIEYHRAWKQVALQGTELLARIAAARVLYQELLRTAEQERAIRGGSARHAR